MYFFKNTAGNWIIGPEPTSLKSKVASELRRDAPTVVTVRTIETRVLLIDRMEVTAIKKNAEGDFYANYAEFLTAVSDFFVNAPLDGAKWKTYKALMSQNGENAPVARVLNQDEDDYLGDGVWSTLAPGYFLYENENIKIGLTATNLIDQFPDEDRFLCVSTEGASDGSIYLKLFSRIGESALDFAEYYIEIKVRQRGTAPVLLSAETNTAGDKVILTFDKKMSGYGLNDSFLNSGWSTFGFETNGFGFLNAIVENNKVIVTISDPVTTSDTQLGIVYDATQIVESFDYGMLGEINNFPITNNVV